MVVKQIVLKVLWYVRDAMVPKVTWLLNCGFNSLSLSFPEYL